MASFEVKDGLSFSEYLMIDAVNQSTLKEVRRSPAHAKSKIETGSSPSKSMAFGTAVHTRLLEPDLFPQLYAIWTGGNKVKNKAMWLEFQKLHKGKSIISQDEFGALLMIEANLRRLPVWDYIQDTRAKKELTLLWDRAGVPCKARIDCIIPGMAIIDVKTTQNASHEAFKWDAGKYGYHNQAAWYTEAATCCGLGEHLYYILAIENTAPYAVAMYMLETDVVHFAGEENEKLFRQWVTCLDDDNFPGYPENPQILQIPEKFL